MPPRRDPGTVTLVWLYMLARVSTQWIVIGAMGGVFAVLFLVAYWATRNVSQVRAA